MAQCVVANLKLHPIQEETLVSFCSGFTLFQTQQIHHLQCDNHTCPTQ
jgi:hypothetical protein